MDKKSRLLYSQLTSYPENRLGCNPVESAKFRYGSSIVDGNTAQSVTRANRIITHSRFFSILFPVFLIITEQIPYTLSRNEDEVL